MIANYGFDDGSGSYYISINTNKCGDCEEKGCIRVCPAGVLISEVNDWDEETAVVAGHMRNQIKTLCAGCKPLNSRPELLPCQRACFFQAIEHSW